MQVMTLQARTPEPNQKGTVLGGPNWKIEGKWAENDKNQSIYEGQGGPGPPTSGVPESPYFEIRDLWNLIFYRFWEV